MNKDRLWQAIGMIDNELITNTIEYEKTHNDKNSIVSEIKRKYIIKRVAFSLASIMLILVGIGAIRLHIEKVAKTEKANMLAELEKYELVEQGDNSSDSINSDYMTNTILPGNVEEAMNMSALVIRCKVQSVGEPYYESYVSAESEQKFKDEGRKPYTYSNIWQDCVLQVEKIYKGECGDEITYRFLSGDIAALEGDLTFTDEDGKQVYLTSAKGYPLKEGIEYVLFLNYNEEKNIYANSISPWYVRMTNSGEQQSTVSAESESSKENVTNNAVDNEYDNEANNGAGQNNLAETNQGTDNSGNDTQMLQALAKQESLRTEFKEFADEYYPYKEYEKDYYVKPEYSDNTLRYVIRDVIDANVCIFAQYGGAKILWYKKFENVVINGYDFIGNDVLVYGNAFVDEQSFEQRVWMARITTTGTVLWEKIFDNGSYEYLNKVAVVENNICIITGVRHNLEDIDSYVALMQVDGEGNVYNHVVTTTGAGVKKAVWYKDSAYILAIQGEFKKHKENVIRINTDGSYEIVLKGRITGANDTDTVYELKDMLVYKDKLYISVSETDENGYDRGAYGFFEGDASAGDGFSYFDENDIDRFNDNYIARLFVYDKNSVQEVYNCDSMLACELSINSDKLVWNVQTIEKAFYSYATSSYSVVTMNFAYEYIFGEDGLFESYDRQKEAVRNTM